MAEYIAKKLAIELMHQSSYLSDGDLLEVNGNLAKARIEAEPAADVAPVVHSTWIENGDPLMLTCGNCGYGVMRYNNTRFCPNCCAKMDGERKENCNEAD